MSTPFIDFVNTIINRNDYREFGINAPTGEEAQEIGQSDKTGKVSSSEKFIYESERQAFLNALETGKLGEYVLTGADYVFGLVEDNVMLNQALHMPSPKARYSLTTRSQDALFQEFQDAMGQLLATQFASEPVVHGAPVDLNQIIAESDVPVVVDFNAIWCGPCHNLAPILDVLEQRYGGQVQVVRVDVDVNPDLSDQYRVEYLPDVRVFVNGMETHKITGLHAAEDYEAAIQSVLESKDD